MTRDEDDEFECFVVTSFESTLLSAYHLPEDESLTRKVYKIAEWNEFVVALREGNAMAIGWKWFPYTQGSKLKGNQRELEVELWFHHPDSKVGQFMVIHVHFSTKWEERHSDPRADRRVTAVNIRHTQRTLGTKREH